MRLRAVSQTQGLPKMEGLGYLMLRHVAGPTWWGSLWEPAGSTYRLGDVGW